MRDVQASLPCMQDIYQKKLIIILSYACGEKFIIFFTTLTPAVEALFVQLERVSETQCCRFKS
jgi:hypothetical protein